MKVVVVFFQKRKDDSEEEGLFHNRVGTEKGRIYFEYILPEWQS